MKGLIEEYHAACGTISQVLVTGHLGGKANKASQLNNGDSARMRERRRE